MMLVSLSAISAVDLDDNAMSDEITSDVTSNSVELAENMETSSIDNNVKTIDNSKIDDNILSDIANSIIESINNEKLVKNKENK